MAKKVVTGEVRLSWPELFGTKIAPGSTVPKYSTMLLIPKSDKKTIKALRDAEKATAEEQKDKFGGKVPAKLKSIIRDGDAEDDDGRSEEHTSELQSRGQLVCRLLLEKKNQTDN